MVTDVSSLGALLTNLPQILSTVQIIAYVALILFFGSIAVVGFRTYTHWTIKMLIRIATGALALISGIALGSFIPIFRGGFYDLLQLNLLINGILASVIIAITLVLITFGSHNIPALEKKIVSLQKKVHDAKSKKPSKYKVVKIAGVVILAVFIIFSIFYFQGFPNLSDRISEFLPDQFQGLLSELGEVSPECAKAASLLATHQDELANMKSYESDQLAQEIETKTGSPVNRMASTVFEGKTIILAVTNSGQTCYSTDKELCICYSSG